jgi:hypothetical protein
MHDMAVKTTNLNLTGFPTDSTGYSLERGKEFIAAVLLTVFNNINQEPVTSQVNYSDFIREVRSGTGALGQYCRCDG